MAQKTSQKPTALITGGAKRIGQAMALFLADCGYDIALHYNTSKTQAQKTASQIQNKGRNCHLFSCDLSNLKAVEKLIPKVIQKHPNLRLLINNASVFKASKLKTSTLESLNRDFDVHLKAPFLLMRDFSKNCSQGQIINILDTHIVENRSQHFTYLLSKKSLADLTKMAAVELAPHVRVNAIAPGLILPPKGKQNDHLKRLAKDIPLKKKGDVKNITQSLEYLLENDYVTGQILFNDGGEHLL